MSRIRLALLSMLPFCGTAFPADHLIKQEHKRFSVKEVHAEVGDILIFVNFDPFVHNIFSLSEVQSFDLGTFGKGEERRVKLLSAGKVEIECAIHPDMRLTIEVAP
jgi:plastocyanin